MVVVGEKNYKHIDEGPIRKRHTRNGDGEADEEDSGMRVGPEYQADIPSYNPVAQHSYSRTNTKIKNASSDDGLKSLIIDQFLAQKPESKHEAVLVWAPILDSNIESRIDDFATEAKNKYGYSTEQALGMLFWHKHNVDKAFQDLGNFTPFPEEWTLEDKVLFEQAFAFHGKTFHRIKAMLPDKTVGSLVKYYYSWKKSRSKTSVIDREVHKVANKREFNNDVMDSEASSGEEINATLDNKEESKSNIGKAGFGSRKLLHDPRMRNKRKPPKGMHLSVESIKSVAKGPFNQRHSVLKKLDLGFVNLRRQVQQNKQAISALIEKSKGGLGDSRLPESSVKPVGKWTNEEQLLAVQGVRKYGKDFKAIAEVIGSKSEPLVRSFYVNYKRRYNLDDVFAEYEREKAKAFGEQDVTQMKETNIKVENNLEEAPLRLVTTNSLSQQCNEPLALVSGPTANR